VTITQITKAALVTSEVDAQSLLSVSVVVPVFNSQDSLPLLVYRLEPVLRKLGGPFELVLVNDGSEDKSWDVIRKLAAGRDWVRGINLLRNYGQHNALLCGIRAVRHDIIVTMDDDLQNPPEQIPRLLDRLGSDMDVVYGCPRTEQHGLWRGLASVVTKRMMQQTMGVEAAKQISAFRVFRSRLREAFTRFSGPAVSIDVLLSWGTTRFAAIDVDHQPRTIGRSNYTIRKLINHTLNMITGFSTVPLRLASLTGFAFTIVGFLLLTFVLLRYLLEGGSVPGFPFLASVLTIFSGAQLFALGIIGEYLARIFHQVMDRPSYTIQSEQEHKGDA
jgi:undecaprenyl-phosphate 4-deoxy-4-formamido-L-arabinose transferase